MSNKDDTQGLLLPANIMENIRPAWSNWRNQATTKRSVYYWVAAIFAGILVVVFLFSAPWSHRPRPLHPAPHPHEPPESHGFWAFDAQKDGRNHGLTDAQ